MRGIQSEFAHALPNLLVLALSIDGPSLSSPVVVDNPARIDEAAHGVAVALLTQYMIFRLTLLGTLEPLDVLAQRDTLLFHPDQIRSVISRQGMSDDDLDSIRKFLAGIRHA